MDVAIAGGHGKIARRLARRLVARGDRVRGLIRNPDHADDLRADGSEPVICDLESAGVEEAAEAVGGADAVVFAAGAGPGSGTERKWSMDRDGAITLLEAARTVDVTRYVIISSVGAESPPERDDTFAVYLRAKAEADRAVMESGLEWTVMRPGMLTDDPGDERVRIELDPFRERVSREDVAAVLEAILYEPRSTGKVLYIGDGDTAVEAALEAALAAAPP